MSYLYIISTKKDGIPSSPIKIGISNDADCRFRQLQTASPYDLEIFHRFNFQEREAARVMETVFLQWQAESRLRGEWFDIRPEAAVELVSLLVEVSFRVIEYPEEYRSCVREELGIPERIREVLA